jgi:hypothetical protein
MIYNFMGTSSIDNHLMKKSHVAGFLSGLVDGVATSVFPTSHGSQDYTLKAQQIGYDLGSSVVQKSMSIAETIRFGVGIFAQDYRR